MDKPVNNLTGSAMCLYLLQRVDKFHCREEANPLAMMLDSLHAKCHGDMRLSGSWSAKQNNVVCLIVEVATMKPTHERLVDFTTDKIVAIDAYLLWVRRFHFALAAFIFEL
jgi:hypothetical protein